MAKCPQCGSENTIPEKEWIMKAPHGNGPETLVKIFKCRNAIHGDKPFSFRIGERLIDRGSDSHGNSFTVTVTKNLQ